MTVYNDEPTFVTYRSPDKYPDKCDTVKGRRYYT